MDTLYAEYLIGVPIILDLLVVLQIIDRLDQQDLGLVVSWERLD